VTSCVLISAHQCFCETRGSPASVLKTETVSLSETLIITHQVTRRPDTPARTSQRNELEERRGVKKMRRLDYSFVGAAISDDSLWGCKVDEKNNYFKLKVSVLRSDIFMLLK
jgi:hypothetical protein